MAATIDHRPTDRHVLGVAVARVLALALRPCSHPCVDKKSFRRPKKVVSSTSMKLCAMRRQNVELHVNRASVSRQLCVGPTSTASVSHCM